MISPDTQALLDAATPRPWLIGECSENGRDWTPQVWPSGYGSPILRMSGRAGLPGRDEADAALIVAAVNDYERLLTVEAERDALKEALKFCLRADEIDRKMGYPLNGTSALALALTEAARVLDALSSPVAEEDPGDPTDGLPPELTRALRDQSIIVSQDAGVFAKIAEWQKAPSHTASADLPAPAEEEET